jgi:DNA-binding Lrp family transcriptional regulator
MDQTDLHLLLELERGLLFVPAPFEEIGKKLDLTGDEVIERIRHLRETGIIRKFRARIDQRKIGITANALVAWKPTGNCNDDIGKLLAEYPFVTHCYKRRPIPGRWEYTHYTVHHGYDRNQVLEEIRKVAAQTKTQDYLVLFSTREFKRVPNVRIAENGGGS